MVLFSVTCTTCRAKLSVKNVAAIGQILGCPKCGGMVQVVAPPGWQPPAQNQNPSQTPGSQTSGLKAEDSGTTTQAAASEPAPTSATVTSKPDTWSDVPADVTGLDSANRNPSPGEPGRLGRGFVLKGAIAAGIAAVLLLSALGFYRWSGSAPDSTGSPTANTTKEVEVAKADPVPAPTTKPEPAISITEAEMVTLDKPAANGENSRPSLTPAGPVAQVAPASRPQVASNTPLTAAPAVPPVQPTTPQPATPQVASPQTAASTPAAPTVEPPASPAKNDATAQSSTPNVATQPTPAAPAVGVAAEKPLPEAQRLPLRDDIAERLADKLPEIELRDVPLVQALRIISQLSTLSITLDLDALAENQLDPESRVSIKMNNATVAEILTALLVQHRLVFMVEEDQVLATTPQRRQATHKTEQYSVADLSGLEPQAVSDLIKQVVAPTTWQQAGGGGTIQVTGANLVIEQTVSVQRQVQTLLDRLRLARGKSVSSPVAGQTDLLVRFTPARSKLAQTVSVNFHEEIPLTRIVDYLEQASGLRIVMDLPALAQVGIAPDAPFSLTADRQSLAATLATLLQPRGLTYRIYNDRTLQVTSLRAARQHLDTEVYKVADLVTSSNSAEHLIGRIKAQVSPTTWRESGGPGVIAIDPSVPCLIVLQTQAVQLQIQELLDLSRSSSRQNKP